MMVNTVIDGRWDVRKKDRWPLAAVASPSGRTIVWLHDGKVGVWHEDRKYRRFLPDDGESLTERIEGLSVRDALMRKDGILVLFASNSEMKGFAYLCDGDIVLVRHENCWIPANQAEASRVKDLEEWPDSFAVMICKGDDECAYYSCGVHRVCFEPGLEVIKPGMLAENPDLSEVTIPSSVQEVRAWAFGSCSNLKNLVIEGNLTRVANWAADAFEGCACEEYYLSLRGTLAD